MHVCKSNNYKKGNYFPNTMINVFLFWRKMVERRGCVLNDYQECQLSSFIRLICPIRRPQS